MLVDAAMVLIIYQHRPNLISACFLPDPGEGQGSAFFLT